MKPSFMIRVAGDDYEVDLGIEIEVRGKDDRVAQTLKHVVTRSRQEYSPSDGGEVAFVASEVSKSLKARVWNVQDYAAVPGTVY